MQAQPWVARFVAIAMLCALAGQSAAAPALAGVVGPGRPAGASADLMTPATSAATTLTSAGQQQKAHHAAPASRSVTEEAKCARSACLVRLPGSRNLPATQQPQARDYFCGPATVSEMLAQMNKKVSQLAAARELGTTPAGTGWSVGTGYPVPNVLNENQSRNDYVAVVLPLSPTRAQIKTYEGDLVTDINHNGGVPLAGDAYEVPGGPHLIGEPEDQEIYHWIDIRGYQKSGAVTDYEDSVHDAPSVGWDVPAYSSLASSTMADILGARGYDW